MKRESGDFTFQNCTLRIFMVKKKKPLGHSRPGVSFATPADLKPTATLCWVNAM